MLAEKAAGAARVLWGIEARDRGIPRSNIPVLSPDGSPIGKVKLLDVEDGTKNAYVPFKKYLEKDVKKACEMAHAFETKLIRGFSFYHPKGTDPRKHLPQVVDQLGQIAETCLLSGFTYGVELEANLFGPHG